MNLKTGCFSWDIKKKLFQYNISTLHPIEIFWNIQTQACTRKYQESLWGKLLLERKSDNLTAIRVPIVYKTAEMAYFNTLFIQILGVSE
jgi:hypothetical protein